MKFLLIIPSLIYSLILRFRHYLYDNEIVAVYHPPIKTICIGNLEFGGTGKTPHAEYLLNLLIEMGETPAFLSRGYGRKTKGFQWVDSSKNWETSGDEPLQVKTNFPGLSVAVCENRKQGILKIIKEKPETTVIVLDDAFQHLQVKAGLNILLTPADIPFTENKLVPAGTLRDVPQAANRADVIIYTKSESSKSTPNFVSGFDYSDPVSVNGYPPIAKDTAILAFCGIANPKPFELHLNSIVSRKSTMLNFKDHHAFSQKDIQTLIATFSNIATENKAIFTTQKDWMRLNKTAEAKALMAFPLYYIPVKVKFWAKENEFKNIINSYIYS